MKSKLPIPVTPALLAWAREESGLEAERVARRLGVAAERLLGWEAGTSAPTLRQVEMLSRVYQRPFSVFFQASPPELPALATEYRRLPGVVMGHESPELRLALRQLMVRREVALDLLEELEGGLPQFRLGASMDEPPAKVGRRLRAALGISLPTQLGWTDAYRGWKVWRLAAEQLGLLVFQFQKVPLEEVRGLALLRRPLPVVAVNAKEVPEARTFTLLHEVVHLMLAVRHEEAPAAQEMRSKREWAVVERFAEAVTGHVLVPDEAIEPALRDSGVSEGRWDIAGVRRVANRFRVTPLALATRLAGAGIMTWPQYRRWRAAWESHVAGLPPRQGGFATPALKAVGRAGQTFARLVLDALDSNRITSVDAGRYLELSFDHFDDLRMSLAGAGAAESHGD